MNISTSQNYVSKGLLPQIRVFLATHWTTQELVTMGVFVSVIKVSALLIVLAGGGMNPLTLAAKNFLFTTLLIVLLHKIPKAGSLTLITLLTTLISLLLIGQGMVNLPLTFLASLLTEAVIALFGGYRKTHAIVIGVLVYELSAKAASLFISFLTMREQTGMLISVAFLVAIGTIGTFAGLFFGVRYTKELRHAGIISD